MLFAVHFSAESENAQRIKSSYEYRWFKTAFEVKCIKTTYSMIHERFGIKSRLIIDPNLMIDDKLGRIWFCMKHPEWSLNENSAETM
jgi:hypothetical protein